MARRTAPGELELVRGFVNTRDLESESDELATPEALAAWLAGRGLLEPRASASETQLRRTLAVRESLRALLHANNGARLDPDAVATLEAAARWADLAAVFDGRGRIIVAPGRPGIPGAIGRLLAVSAAAMADGTWDRLKACPAERCGYAFYDSTRNRSARWCSTSVCGNRTKVRAYRARRRG